MTDGGHLTRGAQMRKQAEACPVPPNTDGEDRNHTPFACPVAPRRLLSLLAPQVHWGEGVSLLPCLCPHPKNPMKPPEGIAWCRVGTLKTGVVCAPTRAPRCLPAPCPVQQEFLRSACSSGGFYGPAAADTRRRKNIPLEPCTALRT